MKSLKSIFSLAVVTIIMASAFVFISGTDPVSTTVFFGTINTSFYLLTSFNVIKLPAGILGTFVGVPGAIGADGSPGIQVISTDRDRAIHLNNSLKAEYSGKELVPGYLRLEAQVTNQTGKLKFPTFTGDSNLVYATEKRLNRNDAFIVTEIAAMLLKQDVANLKTNGLPVSYPNITVFGATAAADLMAIYTSGKLNIEIDKKRWVPDLDMLRFLDIPETQQSGATNFDQFSLKRVAKKMTPQFVINGNGSNEISIDFETYAGFAGGTVVVAGNQHRVVLFLMGLYVADGNAKSSS